MAEGKVAVISEHASPLAVLGGVDSGGQNVYVAQTARHLAALGWEVDVFTRRDDERMPREVSVDGYRVIHVPAGPPRFVRKEDMLPLMTPFAAFMERLCRGARYDLAHANFWMSGLVAAALKSRLGLPFVVTFHALGKVRLMHQGAADGFPRARVPVEAGVMRAADRVIAECPQDAEDLAILYGCDEAKLRLVPCGYDPEEMRPMDRVKARQAAGLPRRGRVILQLGRMVPRKGVDVVIRALGRLVRHEGIEATLVVVGGEHDDPDPRTTPELGRLMRVAWEAGVPDRVVFTGRRDRPALRRYYGAADVFVTTPDYEPFGITPLEAMACARPVVGSAVGGIKYTVAHGATGFLVPPRDERSLARRLAQLFRNPALLRRFSRQARRRVREFTWARVARDLAGVYRELRAMEAPRAS